MSLHGSILLFTQQGMEKYNDVMTKDYFRSTCHRGEECLTNPTEAQPTRIPASNGSQTDKAADSKL